MRKHGEHDVLDVICLEDITGIREEMNTVVYNFNLEPERRIHEFKRLMEKRFPHRFTESELESLLKYERRDAMKFIHEVRSYIFR